MAILKMRAAGKKKFMNSGIVIKKLEEFLLLNGIRFDKKSFFMPKISNEQLRDGSVKEVIICSFYTNYDLFEPRL